VSTEIYYFSGTGNSLVVARDIAEKLDGKLISIPSVMDEKYKDHADTPELYPTYYMRMPGSFKIYRKLTFYSKYISLSVYSWRV
jgi:hypothetical protein